MGWQGWASSTFDPKIGVRPTVILYIPIGLW